MHFSLATVILATLASTVSAADIQVKVGSSGLAFDPPSTNASNGDTVTFVFYPKNHTVTQSTFAAPCQPMSAGVDSGFQPVAANASNVPSFSITVNNTQPLWFYCKQTSHCQTGMVFAINPTANKTFEAFQAAAKGSSSSGTPATSNTTGSGSGSSSASSSGTQTGSSPASPSASSGSNGAVAVGARAGGLLAVVGFAAGILL